MSSNEVVTKKLKILSFVTSCNNIAPIHWLDNDSLQNIFSYLNIKDRFKIERVCSRWQEVTKNSWNSLKKLDLTSEMWGRYDLFGPGQMVTEKNHHILLKVLLICGRYLRSIKLIFNDDDFDRNDLNESNIIPLGKLCPNLETVIIIAPNPVHHYLLEDLSKYCNNVKEFILKDMFDYDYEPIEESLSLFLKSNRQLKVLELNDTCIYEYASLDLPSSLEVLGKKNIIGIEDFLEKISCLKNLKKLKLNFFDSIEGDNIKILTKTILNIGANITNLSLDLGFDYSETCENELSQLFAMTKLKSLKLKNSIITGKCLLNLKGEFVESIKLTCCRFIEPSYVNFVLQNFKNLITIAVNNIFRESSNTIDLDFNNSNNKKLNCIKLKSLLHKSENDQANSILLKNFYTVLELSNLKILNVSNNSLDDDVVIKISQKMKGLINLDISSGTEITDRGLNAISKLPNLKYLDLSYIEKITGQNFDAMPNLITLNCNGCDNISDIYLYKMVMKCPKLRFLDVGDCKKITFDFITSINDEFKIESNSEVFSIHFWPESIDYTTVKEKTSIFKNLNFIFTEYYSGACKKPMKYLQLEN